MMVTTEELREFFRTEFPQADFVIESVGNKSATVRKQINFDHLRPGGTVSGPVLMAMADVALYVAILGEIGLVALAVTTNLNVNFLRRPAADRDIIAECRLIKVGKTLAVGDVLIYSDGLSEPVAQATGTYSIPPNRPG
ncbi:PaaI family thioesterase [Marinobacter sp. F4216]|uniref:PaaI family thioesterase n=1 Tax=Marinobacter sp. F4216 TaxID=2874281 RepID=UPI001CBC67F2|nr:PaaI family thioesterase [Marinobacter sp. F4216]MBZ2169152.1 PaaI family thioesterase [Marinobacter sp. F4216]